MKKLSLIFIAFIVFAVPYFVDASPVLRSGDVVSVEASQSLQGDFYGFGEKVNISGVAEHDVYVAGASVTVNAPVREDLVVAGGSVNIHGEIGDDVRIAGGEVTIGDKVGGDVLVFGGILHILSTAQIEGDVIYAGERLVVDGEISGSVHGYAQQLRINSRVGGDIDFTAQESISLGDNAEVLGTITYTSNSEIARSPQAVVGEVNRESAGSTNSSDWLDTIAFLFVTVVFTALVLYFLGKRHIHSFTQSSIQLIGQNGLIGLGLFIFVPFVSFILMISAIGFPLGLALLCLFVSLLVGSFAFTAVMLGYFVQKYFTKKTQITIQTIVLGAIILSLVIFIPVVGPLLVFAGTMVCLGQFGRIFSSLIRS